MCVDFVGIVCVCVCCTSRTNRINVWFICARTGCFDALSIFAVFPTVQQIWIIFHTRGVFTTRSFSCHLSDNTHNSAALSILCAANSHSSIFSYLFVTFLKHIVVVGLLAVRLAGYIFGRRAATRISKGRYLRQNQQTGIAICKYAGKSKVSLAKLLWFVWYCPQHCDSFPYEQFACSSVFMSCNAFWSIVVPYQHLYILMEVEHINTLLD